MANKKFQDALQSTNSGAPPVWMMRQAGRYHAHYQNLRKSHSFEELCLQPELAAQVAWGPIQDFDFDVAILFSDILFPLQALGFGLEYTEGGPQLSFRLDEASIEKLLPWTDAIAHMEFQKDALQATRAILPTEKSLIGFVGGLWTLFVYAVEGSHAGSLVESKKRLGLFPKFLETLEPFIEANIRLQIEGGAEVVMIFDTAAGELSPTVFQRMVAPALVRLARKFPGRLGYYSKATQKAFFDNAFLQAPWAGMGFDHRYTLAEILRQQKDGFVQGNFDQTLLHLPTEEFKIELERFLEPIRGLAESERANWVCGLGHGVLPKTPEKHVRHFVDRVREVFA